MNDLGNTSTQDDLNTEVYVTDKAIMRSVPVRDGGLVLGYYNEVVMTKEIFVECYKRWILGA